MVMIEDKQNGCTVVLRRRLGWQGIAFPGGHVEDAESFYDSTVREAKEETGLDISDLKHCGTVHWFNEDTKERYIVLLYKTNSFKGKLTEKTEEGEIFWVKTELIKKMNTSPNFKLYLDVFFDDSLNEAFCSYNSKSPYEIIFK